MQPNDRLEVTGTDGTIQHYRVAEQGVLDSRRDRIPTRDDQEELILVTCFPFDAITNGGPLRYVVRAEAVHQAEHS